MKKKFIPILRDAKEWCDREDKSFPFCQAFLADQLLEHFPKLTYENAQDIAYNFLVKELGLPDD